MRVPVLDVVADVSNKGADGDGVEVFGTGAEPHLLERGFFAAFTERAEESTPRRRACISSEYPRA
jgi:hypothetical protein